MNQRDPLGYYEILNLDSNADLEEIKLSYQLLKQSYRERRARLDIGKIRAAYDTLHRADARRAYDLRRHQTLGRTAARLRLPGVLALLLILLGVVLGVIFGPTVKIEMTRYRPGDALILREDGSPFGTVLRFEKEHVFFNNARAEAYLVEMPGDGAFIWYPVGDLNRICSR